MSSLIFWSPLTPTLRSKLFCVYGLGIREVMQPGYVHRPYGTNNFLLMHFHDPVLALVAGVWQEFPANTFLVWPPHTPHWFGAPNRIWTHSWLHCDGETVAASLQAGGLQLERPLTLPSALVTEKYLRLLSEELHDPWGPDTQILQSHFHAWMRTAGRSPGHPRPPEALLRVKLHLENRLAEPQTLTDLARLAHLSASHLSAEFRRWFGAAPLEYRLCLRMRHAAFLLRDANLSVAQVAARLGFEDAFYFSRQFKRRHGLSPLAYRRALRLPASASHLLEMGSHVPAQSPSTGGGVDFRQPASTEEGTIPL